MKPTSIIGGIFAGLFATVWIGGWSAGTLLGDYTIIKSVLKQYHTRDWVQTTGTVGGSGVNSESDSDGGTSYTLDLNYSYQVGGRSYTGTKDSLFNGMISGSQKRVSARAAELPIGKTVPVYYDPTDPSQAVLQHGMEMNDFAGVGFIAIFMTPFNIIMIGSWYFVLNWIRSRTKRDQPAGVSVSDRGGEMRIRLPHTSAAAHAAMALLATSFVMVFVLAFGFLALNLPALSFVAWGVVLVSTVWAYQRRSAKITDGVFDLIFDGIRRTILVPTCDEKRAAVQFKTETLSGITIENEESRDSDGDAVRKFTPTLLYGDNERARITTLSNLEEAQRLAEWLAGKLKTKFKEGRA